MGNGPSLCVCQCAKSAFTVAIYMPQIPESLNRNLLENHTFFALTSLKEMLDFHCSLTSVLSYSLLKRLTTLHPTSVSSMMTSLVLQSLQEEHLLMKDSTQ